MKLERVEMLISHVLRIGVMASLALIVTGLVVSFVHHPGYLWSQADLGPIIAPAANAGGAAGAGPTVAGIATGIASGHGQALIMLGLVLLIATPVLRVAVSVGVFVLQRDWRFVAITLVVLGALLASFWMGRGE